jgi:pectate lyase
MAGKSEQVAGRDSVGGSGGDAGSEADAGASGAHEEPSDGGKGGQGGKTSMGGGAGEGGAPEEMAGASGDPSNGGNGGNGGNGDNGGNGGGGGEIDTFNEPCPVSSLDGWASVAGLEFDPALNVPSWQEVTPVDATELSTYAMSPDPLIIHVSGTFAVPVLDVKSNKVIIGVDRDATLEGGVRIAGTTTATADMVSNVVIRNLRINALTSATSSVVDDSDGIGIAYAHHVWIDHVDVWDAPGDNIDVTHGSDHITVSWTKFRFVDGARRVGARVGDSDANTAEDTGHLKVTFHHNWFQDTVVQRKPRVRFGDVHVFNNYYSGTNDGATNYCVAAAFNSRLLVENNYFDQVQSPHVFFSFVNNASALVEPTAQMVANGNAYVGVSDLEAGKLSGQGSAFTPPYSATLDVADTRLKDFARHCTGPLNP